MPGSMPVVIALTLLMAMPAAHAANDGKTCLQGTDNSDARLEACERYIKSGQARGANLALAYTFRAVIWSHRGDFDRAIEEQSEAIRLVPNDGDMRRNRGIYYASKREPDRALSDFDDAIRMGSKGAAVYGWRGVAYSQKADYQRAIADLTTAIKLDPRDGWLYASRGEVYQYSGKHAEAIADLERALALDPSRKTAREQLARLRAPRAAEDRVAAASVQTGPARPAFEKHGLLGIWAADCSKPASHQNQYIVHRALDAERVQRDTMVGATEIFALVVLETATVSAPNELTMAASGHGARFSITYRSAGNRFRVMQYVRADGRKFIVDGRRDGGGGEMPWLSKCG